MPGQTRRRYTGRAQLNLAPFVNYTPEVDTNGVEASGEIEPTSYDQAIGMQESFGKTSVPGPAMAPTYKKPGFWKNLLTGGEASAFVNDANYQSAVFNAQARNQMQGRVQDQVFQSAQLDKGAANRLLEQAESQIQGILTKLGLPDNTENRRYIEQTYQPVQQQAAMLEPTIGMQNLQNAQSPEGMDAILREFIATRLKPEVTNAATQASTASTNAGTEGQNLQNQLTGMTIPRRTAEERLGLQKAEQDEEVLLRSYDDVVGAGVDTANFGRQQAGARRQVAPLLIEQSLRGPALGNRLTESQITENLRPPVNRMEGMQQLMDRIGQSKGSSNTNQNAPSSVKAQSQKTGSGEIIEINGKMYRIKPKSQNE